MCDVRDSAVQEVGKTDMPAIKIWTIEHTVGGVSYLLIQVQFNRVCPRDWAPHCELLHFAGD